MAGIDKYLEEQAQRIAATTRRVKDYRVFDFNYIPEQPLMRQEAKTVVDACLRYLNTGIANHLLIYGTRGCGKTLLVRYIVRLLSQRYQAQMLYVNCRQQNTSFKILAHLLAVQPRGRSLDELWQQFCDRYRGPMILVLDEVDLVSDKDVNREILYLISRGTASIMTILLSNHPRFLSSLDASVRSSLQPEVVHFHNYDAEQMLEILRNRAAQGLCEIPERELAEIAAFSVQRTNSDVRVAIKTLYYLAMEQESPVISALFEKAHRDLTTEVLADLNERNLLILKAVTEVDEPLVKTVYTRYRHLSNASRQEPFSYMYFYTNLAYLQSIGLILLLSTKTGRTYTNRIQLLFQPEFLREMWLARCV